MQELTVSSLVRYLKNKLDFDTNIQRVNIIGEISNFHRHYSGHLYFTLKDENAQISCVMFKSAATTLKFEPKNGDKVVVLANTSIFENSGQLQLYILKMSLDGLGTLYEQYEALKNKLNEEGYFSDEHKIELNKTYLDKVAVLVGDNSAAMSDIKTTFLRRWPLCQVDYYPVLVQGNDAPISIIESLIKVDKLDYDAIILARGGGSFEDLFCFNNEALVKCIYDLNTFIITGVGHEQDFTLVDFVADQRAATPTASVELITPNIIDVKEVIFDFEDTLKSIVENKINDSLLNYDYLFTKLLNYKNHFDILKNNIDVMLNKAYTKIKQDINLNQIYLNNIKDKIYTIEKHKLESNNLLLKRYITLLEAYSSENVLKRGYTLVKQNNKVIKTKKELENKEFEVRFIDGSIKAIERS
ncbi:MAG: exodeoxyribonuclease VII large subunit [Firmicutes bacterium]|nr:exodeoxyribonuclease VII large subunit [Candidatus Colivicinus equi]